MLADASASTGAIICAPLISAAPSSAEAGAGRSLLGLRAASAHEGADQPSLLLVAQQEAERPACGAASPGCPLSAANGHDERRRIVPPGPRSSSF